MGRTLARSRTEGAIPCSKAITPSRSPCADSREDLHVAPVGLNGIPEKRTDSVLEARHRKEVSLRKGLSEQQGSESKQSSISIPSFQPLSSCSPSESCTSSKISKLGFSSSSLSSSSASSFNETGSFVTKDLSPVSVTSAELKPAECSPARRSFQRISLAPKLAAIAPSRKWDDTEMHCNCSSSPAENSAPRARTRGRFPLEDNRSEGIKGRRQLCSKSRKDDLGSSSLDCTGYYDQGDKVTSASVGRGRNAAGPHSAFKPQTGVSEQVFPSSSYTKSLHCVFEGSSKFLNKDVGGKEGKNGSASFREPMESTFSLRTCSIISNFPAAKSNVAIHDEKCIPSDLRENSHKHRRGYSAAIDNVVQGEIHTDGIVEGCNTGSKLRKDRAPTCNTGGDSRAEGHESDELSLDVNTDDAQPMFKCVLECSSVPYEADIDIDTSSLQQRVSTKSPSEKTKLPRAFSSLQPVPLNERVFSFRIPVASKPKLGAPLHLFERGMPFKRSTHQCASTETVMGKRQVASNVLSDRGALVKDASSSFSDRKPSTTQGHTQKDAKASKLICDGSLKPSLPSSCDDKVDAFTLHSPLLLQELKYSEGSGAPLPNPPAVPSISKAHWDWRSKSLGAKASLKSAVRNLEATFTGSRSLSLPKARSRAQKDNKPDSGRLLERVFVSPIRARSKQVGLLKPIERPSRAGLESEVTRLQSVAVIGSVVHNKDVKEHGVFWRRGAKTATSNGLSHRTYARAPAGFVFSPFPPSGYKDVEVTSKCLLPASRSVRCLPSSRGALAAESLVSYSRRADGLSSHALDGTSPGMLHAQLHCILKDGLPFYTMTVEGSEEIFLARARWQDDHSSKEGCKWQYSFHSGQGKASRSIGGSSGWRSWIKKDSKTVSDLRGIMEVSSAFRRGLALPSRELQLLKVLEFVLYDGKGAGVAHSQSLRISPTEKLCQKSETPSSFSFPSTEHVLSSSPPPLDADSTNRQHARSLTEFTMSSESASTSSSLHKVNGGHRANLSVEVWSDLDVPDSVQVPSSCSPSHVELAALVIQVSAEGHQRDSNVSEDDHIGQNSEGWGLKFLDGTDVLELRSGFSHFHAGEGMYFDCDALGRAELDTNAELKPCPLGNRSGHQYARINRGGLHDENLSSSEGSSMAEKFGRQGLSGSVTLLLPTGDHGFPNGGTRGPSSLIERWRSGGSCECGGWDLGCGIKVISSGSPARKCIVPNKNMISYDQPLSLFAQGSKQELMLGLLSVKQGEFKLSFQGQLSPLRAFAAAVAMLHGHESTLSGLPSPASPSTSLKPLSMPLPSSAGSMPSSTSLPISLSLSSSSVAMPSTALLLSSSTSSSMPSPLSSLSVSMSKFPLLPPSSLLSSSSSLMSSSAIEAASMIYSLKETPPRSRPIHLLAPRRSDSSSKDKITPFLVHNQTFSN